MGGGGDFGKGGDAVAAELTCGWVKAWWKRQGEERQGKRQGQGQAGGEAMGSLPELSAPMTKLGRLVNDGKIQNLEVAPVLKSSFQAAVHSC
eukprot:Skav235192  [mRNA]  locus=scaffold1938:143681:145049:+ [translate_table: standard]